ncbi:hypothetical protein OF83DRAFT_1163779 [Amylostereum chailletii]|nr:hypothetical protein OF83DRAFT_1163779 [Amylostereum chailletii]
MAYNREWDKGKDGWSADNGDTGGWQDYTGGGGRGNVRYREEEYYGDGKRRRYNNGGYDAGQGWDDSSYDAGQYQQPLVATTQQPYAQDDRPPRGGFNLGGTSTSGTASGGFQGNRKRLAPSEPSPHVIFLGLDPDFTEADLQSYLSYNGCSIESTTIIRERTTGTCPSLASSKGFGFAQFSSVEGARAFVDPSFPFIQVPPPASHGATATAAFYKALETGAQHTGRRVKIDFSQSASPGDRGRFGRPANANDGTRDIGNSQAPVLLFRGLDPMSGPLAVHQAMLTSSGLNKEGAKGMKRIVIIKDKVTMASWGFAFVEFVDAQAASTVLAATMSPQIHPNGFRISDKPVAASFAHPYSFQPLANPMLRDEACISSSMALGGVEGTWVRYWDEASTAAILEFKVEEPTPQQQAAPGKEKKKRPKIDADAAALRAIPVEASTLPVSDKPVTLNFKGLTTNKISSAAAKAAPLTLGFSMADDAGTDDEASHGKEDDAKVAAAKKVAPMIASKKIANNINKWNQAQEGMNSGASSSAPVPVVSAPSSNVVITPVQTKADTPPPEAEFEFSDVVKLTCLLCARQFKTMDQLKRHNKESDLHKPVQPKYRDRASERRVMHNQPDMPLPETTEDPRKSRRFAEGPPPPPSPPPPALNPGKDDTNVGNKLLKMMGWKEGTGLGVDGGGRVDPMEVFPDAGAGLGASKGKEVGKYPDGYTGYVHMAKDAARERYES